MVNILQPNNNLQKSGTTELILQCIGSIKSTKWSHSYTFIWQSNSTNKTK